MLLVTATLKQEVPVAKRKRQKRPKPGYRWVPPGRYDHGHWINAQGARIDSEGTPVDSRGYLACDHSEADAHPVGIPDYWLAGLADRECVEGDLRQEEAEYFGRGEGLSMFS